MGRASKSKCLPNRYFSKYHFYSLTFSHVLTFTYMTSLKHFNFLHESSTIYPNIRLSLWNLFYLPSTPTVQFSSVTQSCPTHCDPMNCSTPGLPVHHQLPESTQTHVHWVGDAIQPSHPLSSPSPPALNLSQHQGLFKWKGGQSIGVSASTSVEHPGLISFRMEWLDILRS